jgi:hypothetical protein
LKKYISYGKIFFDRCSIEGLNKNRNLYLVEMSEMSPFTIGGIVITFDAAAAMALTCVGIVIGAIEITKTLNNENTRREFSQGLNDIGDYFRQGAGQITKSSTDDLDYPL